MMNPDRQTCAQYSSFIIILHHWIEKVERLSGCRRPFVAVAAQLDIKPASVADLGQGMQDGGESDLPLAEHQVLVPPAAHVLDVDVDQSRGPAVDHVRD